MSSIKIRKNLFRIAFIVILSMCFTACKNNENEDKTDQIADQEEEKNNSDEENTDGENTDKENTDEENKDGENEDAENKDEEDSQGEGSGEDNEEEVTKIPDYVYTAEGLIKPEYAKTIIQEHSDQVIEAISKKDMNTVAAYVHPVNGVRFTPYTYVSEEKDMVLTQEEVKNFFEDSTYYLWGYYDGTGEEISLTPSQYYEKFIYSSDFMKAEKTGYNEVLSTGNTLENQFEIYEEAIVVEYYFSGFNPEYGGADWQSVRLIFQQYENEWKLVGIIHGQMTL